MHEDLIKRLRELQAITEHCDEQSCYECENRELCDKHDNKTLSGTYKEAADAIEDLTAYVRQIEELRKDGYYLEKIEMTPYGHTIMTGPLPAAEESWEAACWQAWHSFDYRNSGSRRLN